MNSSATRFDGPVVQLLMDQVFWNLGINAQNVQRAISMMGDEVVDDFNERIDMCVLSIAARRADENWNSARVACLDKNGQVAFIPFSRDGRSA
jgi:hypothetical protein